MNTEFYQGMVGAVRRALPALRENKMPVHRQDQRDAAVADTQRAAEWLPMLLGGAKLGPRIGFGTDKYVKQLAILLTLAEEATSKCPHWQADVPVFMLPARGMLYCRDCIPDDPEFVAKLEAELNAENTCDFCGGETEGWLYPDTLISGHVMISTFLCQECHEWLRSEEVDWD